MIEALPVSLHQNPGNAGGRHDLILALREIRHKECIIPFEACFTLYSPVDINQMFKFKA